MTDFSEVPIAAITAIVTTFATLGATKVLATVSSRLKMTRQRLMLRRGTGTSYTLFNRSRKPLLNLSINVWRGSNSQPGMHYGVTLAPLDSISNIELLADDLVKVSWQEVGWRGRPKYRQSTSLRIDGESEFYPFGNDHDPVPVSVGHESHYYMGG